MTRSQLLRLEIRQLEGATVQPEAGADGATCQWRDRRRGGKKQTVEASELNDALISRSVPALNLTSSPAGDERWPGQYIDVTRVRRRDDEGVSWPRPG